MSETYIYVNEHISSNTPFLSKKALAGSFIYKKNPFWKGLYFQDKQTGE